MRQLYNVFDETKIDRETIRIALELKKQLPPTVRQVSLRDPNSNYVPVERKQFLSWMCAKYLHLSFEDGLPLLKQAMKQQYNMDDSFKLCEYCGKPFPFTRATKKFCNSKCRKRFERWGRKGSTGVTVSRISLGKNNSNYDVSGSLPHSENLSVTKK